MDLKKIRVIFMGTPLFCVPVLEMLIDQTNVVAVVTQPDKCVGRKRELKFTPVKEVALKASIDVLQPGSISEDYEQVLAYRPDLIVTCAYGQILPHNLLVSPVYGCVNVHASLLPKLRGGAPLQRCIMDGYDKTGITIMYMDEGMDTGNMIEQISTKITDTDNYGTIHDRLSGMGPELLLKTLPEIIHGSVTSTVQEESEVTFADTITTQDEVLDFSKTSLNLFNQIRGLSPTPGCFTYLDGKRMKVYASRIGNSNNETKAHGEIISLYNDGIGVATFDGEIILTEIQLDGKKRVLVSNYLNGLQKKHELIGKLFSIV